jgi:hypothetical protein
LLFLFLPPINARSFFKIKKAGRVYPTRARRFNNRKYNLVSGQYSSGTPISVAEYRPSGYTDIDTADASSIAAPFSD